MADPIYRCDLKIKRIVILFKIYFINIGFRRVPYLSTGLMVFFVCVKGKYIDIFIVINLMLVYRFLKK